VFRPKALAVLSVALLGAAACSSSSSGGSSRDVAAGNAAVEAGLKAQAAGNITAAVADYQKALKDDPKNKYALFDLGVIDDQENNVGLASAQYQKALAVDPKFEPALYNLAIIYQQQGNEGYALHLYQQAVAANPSDASAHFNLALMLRALPKYRKDGNAQMRIALRLNPALKDPAARGKKSAKGGQQPPTASPTASSSP
jgi:Tfp pilus assembly protein PilF